MVTERSHHQLAPGVVRQDAHGIQHRDSRRQRDLVIQDSKGVRFDEAKRHGSGVRLDLPVPCGNSRDGTNPRRPPLPLLHVAQKRNDVLRRRQDRRVDNRAALDVHELCSGLRSRRIIVRRAAARDGGMHPRATTWPRTRVDRASGPVVRSCISPCYGCLRSGRRRITVGDGVAAGFMLPLSSSRSHPGFAT